MNIKLVEMPDQDGGISTILSTDLYVLFPLHPSSSFFSIPILIATAMGFVSGLFGGLKPSQDNLFLFYTLKEALEMKTNATMDFIAHTRRLAVGDTSSRRCSQSV